MGRSNFLWIPNLEYTTSCGLCREMPSCPSMEGRSSNSFCVPRVIPTQDIVAKVGGGAKNERTVRNEVLNGFKAARENGDIRRNLKPEFILYFLNHMTEMAKDENLLRLYRSPNELVMELTNFFFYGILTPKANSEV